MDYLFDDVLLYRPNEGVLLIVGKSADNVIPLTPVLNRMLLLLIEKKGQLVTREEFLEKVWDNHGRIASSNTLTQYVSTLRKIFSDHLKKEGVVTLPRRGYMLSLDVNVVVLSHDAALSTTLNNPNVKSERDLSSFDDIAVSEQTEEIRRKKADIRINKKTSRVTLHLLTIVTVPILLYILFSERIHSIGKVQGIARIGSCEVYILPDYNSRSIVKNKINMDRIEKHVKQFDLNCIDGAEFFFSNKDNTSTPINAYSLLSRCVRGGETIDECVTTKISGQ